MIQAIKRGFSSTVRFRVGERVLGDIDPSMPELCGLAGTIIAARARFPSTPRMRTINYQVQFDEPPFPEPVIGTPDAHQRLWLSQDKLRRLRRQRRRDG